MKKLVRMILVLCLSFVMLFGLSACNFVTSDNALYHNQKVIYVNGHAFTRGELLNAFYNYGYSQYSNGSMTLQESIEESAKNMINNHLLMEEIKKQNQTLEFINISDHTKEIRYKAQEQMQTSIDQIEDEVLKERGLEQNQDDAEAATDDTYTPQVRFVDGALERVQKTVEAFDNTTTVPEKFVHTKLNGDVSDEAYARFIKQLQSRAKSEGRSVKESAVLTHEEERLITAFTNQKYLTAYENFFTANSEIPSELVIEYFLENYKKQQVEFSREVGGVAAYNTAMQNSSSNFVYYHPTASEGYALVSHVLVQFDDAQKAEIDNLKAQAGSDPYYEKHGLQADIERVAASGLEKEVFALKLFQDIKTDVEAIPFSLSDSKERKMTKFQEYVKEYNDDTASTTADFYYAVNIDTTVTDQMEAAFANAARDMFEKNYQVGQVYFEPIVTAYGYHIMIYAGDYAGDSTNVYAGSYLADNANLFDENVLLNLGTADYSAMVEKLSQVKVNYTSEKTLFQYFYDLISPDTNAFNARLENLIKDVRHSADIKNHVVLYKDLWKNA